MTAATLELTRHRAWLLHAPPTSANTTHGSTRDRDRLVRGLLLAPWLWSAISLGATGPFLNKAVFAVWISGLPTIAAAMALLTGLASWHLVHRQLAPARRLAWMVGFVVAPLLLGLPLFAYCGQHLLGGQGADRLP